MKNLKEITSFLEHLGDAIIIVNDSSEVIFANSACAKLFGYSKDAMKGINIARLMKKETTEHQALVKEFIHSNSLARTMMSRRELPCLKASGATFNARISIASVTIAQKAYGVATIQDFSSIQKELEHLEATSHQDMLTGLYNRRYLKKVTAPNSRLLAKWRNIGAIYMDLNKFKPINDKYGHDVGDAVLKVVSSRIRNCIRFDDMAFRMGGDEFLVFLDLTEVSERKQSMREIAKKVHSEIAKPIKSEHLNLNIDLSAGCGLYPENEPDLKKLIHLTDKAMFSAKKTGKKTIFVG